MSTEVETSPRKARRQQAAEALNAISALVLGPRGAKKTAKQEAKIQRRADRKTKLLEMLSIEPLKLRVALTKAVVAVQCGATAEELQACSSLQSLTDWTKLAEPLTLFATAKGVNPSILLAGLNIEKDRQPSQAADLTVPCLASDAEPRLAVPRLAAPRHATPASEANTGTPAAASPAKEAPKAPTVPQTTPKAPHGRHVVKGRG